MIQALAHFLARLCIWAVGLPAVSVEARRAEAAKAARDNVALCVAYRGDDDDDDGPGGETIDARGIGFGEYLGPACDCDDDHEDGHEDDHGRVRS